jgi:hypothetical protein
MPDPAGSVPPAGAPAATRTRARWIDRWRKRARADDRAPGDIACRNCGTDAPGAFCPACGQETTLRLPSAGQFMRDAAGRYVAFDGRMWRTLVPLLCRPGFLTREYLAGRRRRYIRPARLVLVLALVMFAVARFVADPATMVELGDAPATPPAGAQAPAPEPKRPLVTMNVEPPARPAGKAIVIDDRPAAEGGSVGLEVDDALNLRWRGMASPLGAAIDRRLDAFNRLDRSEKVNAIVGGMLRYGPYALVGLLPAFALLLQVLYVWPRPAPGGRAPGGASGDRDGGRPCRYSEHLVFAAHNHAFLALAGTLLALLPWTAAIVALVAWVVAYLPLSMRRAYGGGWPGILARSFVVTVVYSVLFALALVTLVMAAIVLR